MLQGFLVVVASNVNANSPDNKYDITNETDDSSNNGGLNGIIHIHRQIVPMNIQQ